MSAEWISVKDRLPADGQYVLAYGPGCQGWTDGPKMTVARLLGKTENDFYDEGAEMMCWTGCGTAVTHWMPLPASPGGA